ncbi:DUF6993 domain-containing protein [Marisediminicola senii]|uniref:DUF6993 domain-containing protein n=1 Tax=Marisediminicola senii TaxID=2711233 RepID=UPI0013EAD425|nr:hypothetical protein [Marisediminicola senii]
MAVLRRRVMVAATAGLLSAGLLAGCTATPEPAPSPSPTATESAPSPTPAAEPVLVPEGSADDNLPYFDLVNRRLLDGNPVPGGRAIIDNLVAAGFDRSAMQVTPDATAIGRDVDSVQFSVRIADRCLVGQARSTGYTSIVAPGIIGGACLVGSTRAIDW